MIAEELGNVETRPSDTLLVEGLATQLVLIRRVHKEALVCGETAATARQIESDCWKLALGFAADLRLSEDALKRIAWLH